MDKKQIMKDLPPQLQPYERCWRLGAEALSDAELLSVLLRSGTEGETALALSARLLGELPSHSLAGLYHVSLQDLRQIRGIGKVKAVQLKCAAEISRRIARERVSPRVSFQDADTVAEYYMEELRHAEQEQILLLMLDSKGGLLGEKVISLGTVNGSLISPREIFLTALSYHAVSIILLHNHPSGDPTPSEEDIMLTKRIGECGMLMEIHLLDHIIIGDRRAVSLFREGYYTQQRHDPEDYEQAPEELSL